MHVSTMLKGGLAAARLMAVGWAAAHADYTVKG